MYSKYQGELEKHRTYISSHRCDVDASAQYLAMEDTFIQIGKGSEGGKDDPWYKMNSAQKDCLDSFMAARGGKLLYGKSNMDKSGKPRHYDPETGRGIVAGDGIIPQVERFANKFVFSRLNSKLFNKALNAMVSKSDKATGNRYVFVCNELMWTEIQETLSAWIRDWKTTGTFLFSKAANGYVDVGATYQSYEFGGNFVTFKVDRSLNVEFPNKKVGMFLDLTADGSSGRPSIAMFTFKNGEFIHNYVRGVGGKSGLESGEVSSRVAGSKEIV